MFLIQIVRTVIPLVVLGIVSDICGADDPVVPTAVPSIDLPPPDAEVSGHMMKLFDVLGLTATNEEISNYTRLLLEQRRHLQHRMTRHMVYTALIMVTIQMFGGYSMIKGSVAAAYWLNNNYRETINADWIAHQQQLAQFILEYSRVKDVKLSALSTNFLVGAPVIKIPYAENEAAEFPVWLVKKGQNLPKEAEIRGFFQLLRNWRLRK